MATVSTMVFAILLIGLTTFLVLLRKRRKYSDDVHLLPAPVRVPCVSYNPLYFAPYWKCVKTCRCPILLTPDCDIYNITLFIVVLRSVVVWFLNHFFFLLQHHPATNPEFPRLELQEGSHWLWGHEKELFDGSQPEVHNAWTDRLGGAYRIDGALWVSFLFLIPFRFFSIADIGRTSA